METQTSSTQTVQISVLKRESNVPIYQTNVSPITYSKASPKIVKKDVQGVEGCFVLENVLTQDECKQFVEITEKMGYEDAPVTVGFNKMVLMKDVRDNKRVMWQTNEEVWNPIWERIKALIPKDVKVRSKDWTVTSLNERFRFYRYQPGEVFNRHFDGSFPRNINEMSLMTIIVYLTDGFDGGYTTFYTKKEEVQVKPVQGNALCFFHGPHPLSPEHEGSACEGSKYVLRSDIMYKRQ